MPAQVLMTMAREYVGNVWYWRHVRTWAERVDMSDGVATAVPHAAAWSHHVEVAAPLTSPPRRGPRQRILRTRAATIRAFREAGRLADGGFIQVYLGQGRSGRAVLAPGGALDVDPQLLEKLWRAQQTGATPENGRLRNDEVAVVEIGRTLWDSPTRPRRPRVRRVDILSENSGVGRKSQRVLDWLQHLWGVPVRGLIGRLGVGWPGSTATVMPPSVRAVPPTGGPYTAGPVTPIDRYVDTLPVDDHLWLSSRRRRPALTLPEP